MLIALAGGVRGFPERLNAIVSFLVFLFVGLLVVGIVVFLIVQWHQSRRGEAIAEEHGVPGRRVEPLPEGREMDAVAKPMAPHNPATNTTPAAELGSTERWGEKLRALDWYQFEKLMEQIYARQGYRVERRGGAKADGGVDLILEKEGKRAAVQCKHWRGQDVGVRHVREFLGALTDKGLKEGVLVTLNGFTGDAKELAERHGIELLAEKDLLTMLLRLDVAYDREFRECLTNPEKRCPKCEAPMKLRTAGKGWNKGAQFWGCSAFPRCRFILPVDQGVAGREEG